MTRAPVSSHPSWNFLLLNSNLLDFSMVTVKEHVDRILRVLQIFGISVAFSRPSDFSTATYEADWLAEPNQTYSNLNQQILQTVITAQVSSQNVFQNYQNSPALQSSPSISRNFASKMQMVLFLAFIILLKHITSCVIDKNILLNVILAKTLLRKQRMKPISINNVNTCSNFKPCNEELSPGLQADAPRVPHDTLADCESTQDIIGVPEDEANIVKKCVTCSSSDFYDVSFLVCPMEDRLMLIDVYTTVYTTTSIAMYVCANCCYDYAYYDACFAMAVLGSAKSTLGLPMFAVIVTAYSKQYKMDSTTEYMEEGKKKEEEKKKKNRTTYLTSCLETVQLVSILVRVIVYHLAHQGSINQYVCISLPS